MREVKSKGAARCLWGNRKVFLSALTLMLCAIVSGATREHRARCSFEAKVSIERIGPHGTFAGHRPDSTDGNSAATLALRGSHWAAGSIYRGGGEGVVSRHLHPAPKSVIWEGSRQCEV